MSDKKKKKVAFKLRFSNQKELPRKKEVPQMITEWNYTRIAMALIILFILMAVGISIFQNEDMQVATENNTPGKQIKEANNISQLPNKTTDSIVVKAKKQPVVSNIPIKKQTPAKILAQIPGKMVRAQLAKGIWKNEPFGKITGTIKVNREQATGVFYFTELENMKDKTVFHIWKYKGEVIFKKKKKVLEDRWNTYSSKLFTRRSIGPWSVETVDSNNQQLNVINFKVVAATD